MNSKLGLVSLAASLTALVSFIACTDYQEEFDNNFGILAYESYVESSETNQDVSSGSVDLSSTTDKVSSGAEPLSSGSVPTQSSGEQSYSSVGSSGSAKTSSSSTASLSGYNPPAGNYGEVVYKGQKYRTVTIGDQEWMAENLNYAVDGSYCYNDAAQNCDKFGRLYSWEAARNACPEGWHLPDSMEWTVLFKSVGTDAATHLKATSGWDSNTAGNGDDAVGFSVLPAGGGSISGGVVYYSSLTNGAVFWTNKKISDSEARSVSIYGKDKNPEFIEGNINDRRSVRCLKGLPRSSSSSAKSSSSSQSSSSSVESSSSRTCNYPQVDGCFTDTRDGQTYNTVIMNNQYWMAQNLNYELENSYCYENKQSNCDKYGKLYAWSAAVESACPEGWHLPTKQEFDLLLNYVGGTEDGGVNAAKQLKSKNYWADEKGTDSYNFALLPAGYCLYEDNADGCSWSSTNNSAFLWSSSKYTGSNPDSAVCQHGDCAHVMILKDKKVSLRPYDKELTYMSVRCVLGKLSSSSSAQSSSSIEVAAAEVCKSRDGGDECEYGSVKIAEDTYKTVKIGEQWWMAENANYTTTKGSYCYKDNETNCETYGRLYTWAAANEVCSTIGDGWRLPSKADFDTLVAAIVANNWTWKGSVGKLLKSTEYWPSTEVGTDNFGFNALPAGERHNSTSVYQWGVDGVMPRAEFWSSTTKEGNDSNAYRFYLDNTDGNVHTDIADDKSELSFSVRCVKSAK